MKSSGNRLGDKLESNRSRSKPYTKNSEELLHDLLCHEAAKMISSRIEQDSGTVTEIVTDNSRRSEIYTQNFRSMGEESKTPIIDLEIRYQSKDGEERTELIEIDRGYRAQTIAAKSGQFSQSINWFTDSRNQANKIVKHAKSFDKVYLIQ